MRFILILLLMLFMSSADSPDQAVHSLYLDHHSWLYRWLCKKMSCPHRAADMAQDTFLRLFSFVGLSDLREPRAFLTTAASRLMIDAARRRKIEQAYLENYSYYAIDSQTAPSAEALAAVSETLLLISRMLDGLPANCRQAFLMNRLDGMKHAEIAEELGVSKSSVKNYLASAMLHCHRIASQAAQQ